MRLASVLPRWSPVRALSRRLRPLPDLDPAEVGPTPQAVSATERAELAAARPFRQLGGPTAWPLVGSAGAFIGADRSRIGQLFVSLRERYGDLYRLRHPLRGNETVVSFNSDDAEKVFRSEGSWPIRPGFYPVRLYNKMNGLKHGLVSSNGSEWSELRAVVQQQLLRTNALQPFIPHIESSAADMVAALAADRDPQQRLNRDFLQHAYRGAVDVIQKVSLGSAAYRDPDERFLLLRSIRDFFNMTAEMEMHINTWRYVATRQWKRFTHALDCFNMIADKWLATALSQDTTAEPNMLAMLHEKGLSREQVKAIVVDFFMAGVDTTGIALTCLLYHLATNPEYQERAYREVQQVVPPPGQVMTQEHTNRLQFIRACAKENLRISAPLMGYARKLGKDIVIGGHRIPKGKVVFMVASMTSRSRGEFSDPETFLPDRWLRSRADEADAATAATATAATAAATATAATAGCPAAAAASPFAHLPFGHGRRMCIGRRLSEQEFLIFTARACELAALELCPVVVAGYMALALLVARPAGKDLFMAGHPVLQRFRLKYNGPPLQLNMHLLCKPDAPLQFTLEEREDQ